MIKKKSRVLDDQMRFWVNYPCLMLDIHMLYVENIWYIVIMLVVEFLDVWGWKTCIWMKKIGRTRNCNSAEIKTPA